MNPYSMAPPSAFLPIFFIVSIVTVLLPQLVSCYAPIGYRCQAATGASTPSQTDIDGLLATLVANVTTDKFVTASTGNGDSAVYGLLQCRADVPSAVCLKCAQDAAGQAKSLCQKGRRNINNGQMARVWFDFCYLRYDTTNFISKLDASDGVVVINPAKISVANLTLFSSKVDDVMNVVVVEAGKGASVQSIGLSLSTYSRTVVIWALAQCTRDVSPVLCRSCLDAAISYMQPYKTKKGFQINYGSCNIRYDIRPFFYPFIKK